MSATATRDTVSAVVVTKHEGEITVGCDEVARPTVGRGQLLVRPAYVGICGSDLEQLADHMPATFDINYPHILGHEWSGEVQEVGADVEGFRVGDKLIGHGDLGENRWFGVTHDGAMAELFVVEARVCFRLEAVTDLRTAAVVEPFACVFAAFRRLGALNAAHRVHVHGLGAIGLCAVIQAAAVGAAVTVVDPSERRRDLALRLGARLAIDPTDTTAMDELASSGDVVVEASGSPHAQAAAIESASHGGRVLYMGVSRPRPTNARLGLVQERDLTLISSTGAPPDAWEPALRMLQRLQLDLGPLVSSTYPFTQIALALARAADPGAEIKVLLHP
jgi:threonine dehydrogenase-like Zn-dependent dehydrogenase